MAIEFINFAKVNQETGKVKRIKVMNSPLVAYLGHQLFVSFRQLEFQGRLRLVKEQFKINLGGQFWLLKMIQVAACIIDL